MQKTYDAVVIGAGPAGVSCAIWLKRLGFEPLVLEASDRVGGLSARNPFYDLWTPTLAGRTGIDIAHDMASQLEASGAEVWLNSPVETIAKHAEWLSQNQTQPRSSFMVSVQHDGRLMNVEARTVVIAAGVKARQLQPGPNPSWPGVIIGPGEQIVKQDFAGKSVALLGGGDNAFENYEFVKTNGAKLAHIYARSIRAQKQFVSRLSASDVQIGPYEVDPTTKTVNGNAYDLLIVLYGWEAQAYFAAPLALKHNAKGFIATDHDTAQTSQVGVYAIGEVAQRMHPCVVTAFADGVVAAKAIEAELSGS
jgi:thioredoxin reductase